MNFKIRSIHFITVPMGVRRHSPLYISQKINMSRRHSQEYGHVVQMYNTLLQSKISELIRCIFLASWIAKFLILNKFWVGSIFCVLIMLGLGFFAININNSRDKSLNIWEKFNTGMLFHGQLNIGFFRALSSIFLLQTIIWKMSVQVEARN